MPIDHLPPRLRAPAERLRAWALTDAVLLVLLGAAGLSRGISYLRDTPVGVLQGRAHPSESWMPLEVWGWVWITVAVLCLATSLRHRCRLADWGLYAGLGLHVLWGLSLIKAGLWLTGSWYLLFAASISYTVWRGSRMELRIREVRHDRTGAR